MRRISRAAHVMIGVACALLLSLLAADPVAADDSEGTSYRHRQITIDKTTKDIHIEVSGKIQDKGVKVHNDTAGKDVKFDDEQYDGKSRWSGGTQTPIGGTLDKLSIDVGRNGTGPWNMKVWQTTDGNVTSFPTVKPTDTFASLFIQPVSPGMIAIVAYNDNPTQSVSYTALTTWESNDLSTFNLDQFRSIDTGTPLPDSIYLPGVESGFSLAPGETKVLTTNLTEDLSRYFYVEAQDVTSSIPGGLTDGFAFQATAAVPEPSTLILAGTMGLLSFGYGWIRRKRAVA